MGHLKRAGLVEAANIMSGFTLWSEHLRFYSVKQINNEQLKIVIQNYNKKQFTFIRKINFFSSPVFQK